MNSLLLKGRGEISLSARSGGHGVVVIDDGRAECRGELIHRVLILPSTRLRDPSATWSFVITMSAAAGGRLGSANLGSAASQRGDQGHARRFACIGYLQNKLLSEEIS
jgi:hypothetical protein